MSKSFKKLESADHHGLHHVPCTAGDRTSEFRGDRQDTAAVNDGVRVSYEDVSGQVESLAQSEMLNNMTEETAAPGPDDIVTVIVELSGKPMLDFAMEKTYPCPTR